MTSRRQQVLRLSDRRERVRLPGTVDIGLLLYLATPCGTLAFGSEASWQYKLQYTSALSRPAFAHLTLLDAVRSTTWSPSRFCPPTMNIMEEDQQSLSTVGDSVHNGGESFRINQVSLCGRGKERLSLLKAYLAMLECRHDALCKTVVVVHGTSGIGKTSLVEILRDPVTSSHGYFVAGKFCKPVEGVMQEPHSAVMAAFSDLCDLVLQSVDFDECRRMEIQEALGTDAELLVRAFSGLSPFLDVKAQLERVDPRSDSALAKFNAACRKFLNAMSSARHPIVLFIDDVQWMDEGSRQLLETLLKDDEIKK